MGVRFPQGAPFLSPSSTKIEEGLFDGVATTSLAICRSTSIPEPWENQSRYLLRD